MLLELRMSSLDQMKLMGLIDLTLILILASNSKGQSWNISVTKSITATLGSNVTIECSFTVPSKQRTESVQVYWKKPERSNFNTFDNDPNAFVFHPNDTLVLEKYRGKTKLIGNKSKGDCSLKICDITDNVPNIYVRVIAKGDNYSFKANSVSISVSGVPPVKLSDIHQITPTLQTSTIFATVGTNQETKPQRHLAIYGPVVAILIIIVVVGVVVGIKHKRSKSVTREDSGYYANFSRENQLKREVTCKKQEHIKLSEEKDIDDPVYINLEAPPGQTGQTTDHTDNVYGNVDYSKQ
ncbi:uncharacterized protein LOC130213334 [Pseudoliparis swirei]|uniref:uncharacterized protein LOC130213334 n=1 Tax=Pseudoliparis swirei TaxID=2059687 RepID=UPI0024BD5FB9|nr:uncharacterized protein LOC130213334 [Pseudoliparis swirei]